MCVLNNNKERLREREKKMKASIFTLEKKNKKLNKFFNKFLK